MKNLLLRLAISAALLLMLFDADAQTHLTSSPPVLYVDSVKINYSLLEMIDPMEIDSLSIAKAVPNGAIYLKLKDHKKLKMLLAEKLVSLQQISEKHLAKADLHRPKLFFIDKSLVTDTAGLRMPLSKIVSVTVTNASESPYLRSVLPKVLLIYISREKLDQVRIRGGQPSR